MGGKARVELWGRFGGEVVLGDGCDGGGAGRLRDGWVGWGGQRLYCFAWWGPIHGYSVQGSLFTECIQWRNAAASIRMR